MSFEGTMQFELKVTDSGTFRLIPRGVAPGDDGATELSGTISPEGRLSIKEGSDGYVTASLSLKENCLVLEGSGELKGPSSDEPTPFSTRMRRVGPAPNASNGVPASTQVSVTGGSAASPQQNNSGGLPPSGVNNGSQPVIKSISLLTLMKDARVDGSACVMSRPYVAPINWGSGDVFTTTPAYPGGARGATQLLFDWSPWFKLKVDNVTNIDFLDVARHEPAVAAGPVDRSINLRFRNRTDKAVTITFDAFIEYGGIGRASGWKTGLRVTVPRCSEQDGFGGTLFAWTISDIRATRIDADGQVKLF